MVCGDVNTAHTEIDIARPKENENSPGFMPVERAWVSKLVAHGYHDTFRIFVAEPGHYTWWDMKTGGAPATWDGASTTSSSRTSCAAASRPRGSCPPSRARITVPSPSRSSRPAPAVGGRDLRAHAASVRPPLARSWPRCSSSPAGWPCRSLPTASSLPVLSEALGWSRGAVSIALSINLLVGGLAGFGIGALADRYGPRVMLVLTVILAGAAFALVSLVDALWQLYLSWDSSVESERRASICSARPPSRAGSGSAAASPSRSSSWASISAMSRRDRSPPGSSPSLGGAPPTPRWAGARA